jgi:hypothetical protein
VTHYLAGPAFSLAQQENAAVEISWNKLGISWGQDRLSAFLECVFEDAHKMISLMAFDTGYFNKFIGVLNSVEDRSTAQKSRSRAFYDPERLCDCPAKTAGGKTIDLASPLLRDGGFLNRTVVRLIKTTGDGKGKRSGNQAAESWRGL